VGTLAPALAETGKQTSRRGRVAEPRPSGALTALYDKVKNASSVEDALAAATEIALQADTVPLEIDNWDKVTGSRTWPACTPRRSTCRRMPKRSVYL